jgi:hypothetical protein
MALMMPDLRADAIAEARRLAGTRAFQRDGDDAALARSEGVGPLITRARRNRLRRQLGKRTLLVWRVSCEDGAGRIAESRLFGLLVDIEAAPSTRRRRAWLRAVLREAEAPLRQHVEATAALWRETAAAVAGGFASAQIHRAQAIVARLADARYRETQTGLFDRRAERAGRAEADAAAERHRHAHVRLTYAALLARLSARPGELLLVLTP